MAEERGAKIEKKSVAGKLTDGATSEDSSKEDVVVACGKTSDGKGMQVVRKRGEELSLGEVRPMVEGKPVSGEVVSLRPRHEQPRVFDVEVQYAGEETTRSQNVAGAGPARVSNRQYRSGWDSIWGKRARRRLMN